MTVLGRNERNQKMDYQIQELRKFINSVCSKNICHASKEMALSHLVTIETKLGEQTEEVTKQRPSPRQSRSVQARIIRGEGIFG